MLGVVERRAGLSVLPLEGTDIVGHGLDRRPRRSLSRRGEERQLALQAHRLVREFVSLQWLDDHLPLQHVKPLPAPQKPGGKAAGKGAGDTHAANVVRQDEERES